MKKHLSSFLFFGFSLVCLLSCSYVVHGKNSDAINRGYALKAYVDQANQSDLKTLWALVRTEIENQEPDPQVLYQRVQTLIKKEFVAAKQIKIFLDEQEGQERGSFELRTSLVKLIGTEEREGILINSWRLFISQYDLGTEELKQDSFLATLDFDATKPQHNQITVHKMLFILLLKELGQESPSLKICYPAKLPRCLSENLGKMPEASHFCLLKKENSLPSMNIPNAGYIYGGNLIDGVCYGTDCSGYVSHCCQTSIRWWTGGLVRVWEELEKQKKLKNHYTQPTDDWILSGMDDFESISTLEEARPGDIVVIKTITLISSGEDKKTTEKSSRHVVLFEKWLDNSKTRYQYLEANRFDDNTLEGIMIRQASAEKILSQNKKRVFYVLRRK